MKRDNQPEIELTLEDITQGTAFTRKMVIESTNPHYDGKTITYRTLTTDEMATAMKNANMGRGDDPIKSINFLVEACKIGIVSPGVGKVAGRLDKSIIEKLGIAILGVSQPSEKAVEAVFQE